MHKQIPVLLINLDRRPDRLDTMQKRLENIRYHRISAVDGKTIDDSAEKKILSPDLKYTMSKSEIAVTLSHRAAWEWIVENQSPATCILEDDVHLSPEFPRFIQNTDWLPDNFDLVKIETMLHRVWLSRSGIDAYDRTLYKLRSTHAGTAGYIVSLHGAGRLLETSLKPDRVIDDLVFEIIMNKPAHAMTAFQLSPAICAQDFVLSGNSSDSDIEYDRKHIRKNPALNWRSKLWREIRRPCQQLSCVIGHRRRKSMKIKYR